MLLNDSADRPDAGRPGIGVGRDDPSRRKNKTAAWNVCSIRVEWRNAFFSPLFFFISRVIFWDQQLTCQRWTALYRNENTTWKLRGKRERKRAVSSGSSPEMINDPHISWKMRACSRTSLTESNHYQSRRLAMRLVPWNIVPAIRV